MTNSLDEPDQVSGARPQSDDPALSIDPQQVPHPEATKPFKVQWQYAIVLTFVHAAALLAFVGWFFTWSGLVVGIAGHFIFGMLGI